MGIKKILDVVEEKVLNNDTFMKCLSGFGIFILFLILIYTARNPTDAQAIMRPWFNFTGIAIPVGLIIVWIMASIEEKIKNEKLSTLIGFLIVLGFANWILFMLFAITVGSVIWVIDFFTF